MAAISVPAFDLTSPGSIVYDGFLAAKGSRINAFAQGLKREADRDHFKHDPDDALAKAVLTDEERARIRSRDYRWLSEQGGHIQALQRIAAMDGHYLFHVAAHTLGVNVEDLRAACPRRVSGLGGIDG